MPPLFLMVKPVSGLCNMRCDYCFYQDEMARRAVGFRGVMSDETLENMVRRAFAYAEGRLTFAFQGGEPTLAGADYYRKLLRLEKTYNRRGLPVTHAIQTNGLSLDDALLDVLEEGRFLAGVSLDGDQATHDAHRTDRDGQGTYARVAATIGRLGSRQIEYNILCVLGERAAAKPETMYRALRKYTHLQFIPRLEPPGGDGDGDRLTPETYGRFLIEMFRFYQEAFHSQTPLSIRLFDDWVNIANGFPPGECGYYGRCTPQFVLESDGAVYPCDFYALDEWRLGNVNEQSFFQLGQSPVQTAFCGTRAGGECLACPWRWFCRYGCRRERDTDGEPGPSRWCSAYRMFFETCGASLPGPARRK